MLFKPLSYATSFLPHVKVPVPYRLAPKRSLKVYLDSELGLPLNFREPKIQNFFNKSINNYRVVFDVGAHIGTYSILATRSQNVEVHSFEPYPDNIKRLEENISHNEINDQVEVVSSAVTDSNGQVKLRVGTSDSTHSVVSGDAGSSTIIVDSVTLDSYCNEHTIYPDLVKVDVEGGGKLVIEGASEIMNQRPDWLVEIHSKEEKRAFRDTFETRGYSINKITDCHWFMSL